MYSSLMMEAVRTSKTSVDNHFTRQYIPEDNSEHHTRRHENLKSHVNMYILRYHIVPTKNKFQKMKYKVFPLSGTDSYKPIPITKKYTAAVSTKWSPKEFVQSWLF
jgi:hypothetical protein